MSLSRTLTGVLIFAFVTRLLLIIYFPLQDTDYHLINTAAQNLIDGHGMGYIKSSCNDLSNFYFEGLRLWPPLVSLLTATFLKITGSIEATDWILVLLLLVVLFIYVHKLFTILHLSTKFQLIGYLFIATNPEIIKQPGLSDLAAATFCIASCTFLYKALTETEKYSIQKAFMFACVFFLPSAFRYQFYPITLLFPLSILLAGFLFRNEHLKKKGLLFSLLVIMFIIGQELFLFIYTQQPLTQSVSMDNRGIFLYNLSFIYPFLLKSFVNVSYLENKYDFVYGSISTTYSILTLILFAVWIYALTSFTKKQLLSTKSVFKQSAQLWKIILVCIILIPFLTLILLSVVYNSRSGLPGGWTYVKEGRYYIVSSLLILALSLWYLQERIIHFSTFIKRSATILLLFILIYNSLLTVKFYYNIAVNNIPDKEIENRSDRIKIEKEIQRLSSSGIPTVICSDEPYFAYYPFQQNVAIATKTSTLVTKNITTSKPVQLLIISQYPVSKNDSLLIAKTNATKLIALNNNVLFHATILPSTIKMK